MKKFFTLCKNICILADPVSRDTFDARSELPSALSRSTNYSAIILYAYLRVNYFRDPHEAQITQTLELVVVS